MIYGEITQAIFSSSLKELSNLDKILFLILQKLYQIIPNLLHMIFSDLIKNEYYF